MKARNIFLLILLIAVIFSVSCVVAKETNDTVLSQVSDDSQSSLQTTDISAYDTAPAKKPVKISVKSVKGKQKTKAKLTAKVKTSNNEKVKGANIKFNVNGKVYTAKTNSKGIATVKIKLPKAKYLKTTQKTKKKILTITKKYKKPYKCTATFSGDDKYSASSAKFKVTPIKKSKIKKYKINKKKKSIILPTKKKVTTKRDSKYIFAVQHDIQEGHRLVIAAGDYKAKKLIKFYSNIFVKKHGKVKYLTKKGTKSKTSNDYHIYTYSDISNVYVLIKYFSTTYKRI